MGQPPSGPVRIVILGGGYAGAYCAQRLERLVKTKGDGAVEIILIDRQNYFVFYPLLVEAGTGNLEPRHVVVSIRAFIKRTRFIMARVDDVDFVKQEVVCRLPETEEEIRVGYSHLVIALGSVTRLPDVPGLREHGMEMKSMADAVHMRDHAINMLEGADAVDDPAKKKELLHFVVVGGNFTGAEVAGELEGFLPEAAAEYERISPGDIKVTLVELSERILHALGDELSDYATQNLRRRGVDVRTHHSVVEIGRDYAIIERAGGAAAGPSDKVQANGAPGSTGLASPGPARETVRTRTVIWCAGIAPSPLALKLAVPRDPRGYILCERDLRVKGFENVWGIGDCAVLLGPDGKPYPATAQHATREGKHLAENLARVLRGEATRPCDIVNQGSLAALGCRTGVAQIFGMKVSGFIAWWLWRTVYLMKTPGWGRRIRVAMDWTLDLIFKRDHVQLGVHPGNGKKG